MVLEISFIAYGRFHSKTFTNTERCECVKEATVYLRNAVRADCGDFSVYSAIFGVSDTEVVCCPKTARSLSAINLAAPIGFRLVAAA